VPRNQCVTSSAAYAAAANVDPTSCGYPAIYGADGSALNATAALSADKRTIVLTAIGPAPAGVNRRGRARRSASPRSPSYTLWGSL
jgi:hypothetical protein